MTRAGDFGHPCRRLRELTALAEFIRELIVEGTHEGLDAARARGVRLGRPPAPLTAEQIRFARDLLTHPENTVTSIAKLLDVSRNTIYEYLPELHAGPALSTTSPGRDPDYVGPLRALVTGPAASKEVRDRIQGKGRPGKF